VNNVRDKRLPDYRIKVGYNCLSRSDWKYETPTRLATFLNRWRSEIQERVLPNWTVYGDQLVETK
jgi:hypothetical protein